jgi:hypothetical protein
VYKNQIIRKLSVGAMLMLFALSITPNQLLHYVITGHKHSYVKSGGSQSLQTAKNNFQCNWDDHVVVSPFTDQPGFQLQQPVFVYASYINHYTLRNYVTELFFSSLRGPPAQV